MWFILILSVTTIVMSVAAIIDTGPSHGKVVMCDIDAWAVGKADHLAELNLCTHLTLSHSNIVPWDDKVGKFPLNVNVSYIREIYPHLKVSFGFYQKNNYYFNMTLEERSRFITDSFDFLVRNKFDGLFMQYSISHICLDPLVHQKHTAFIKELKEKFNDNQLLLTLSFRAFKKHFFRGFDYTGIAKCVDFLHFQLARANHRNYKNELQTRNIHDLQYVIDEIIKMGVPSTKILMNIPFGGFEILSLNGNSETDSENFNSYLQNSDYICFHALHRNYNFTYNSEFGVTASGEFLIESSRVIANKIRFAMRKNVAGAYINELNWDDHHNRCAELDIDTYEDYKSVVGGVTLNIPKRTGGHNFFANIVNEAIVVALDEIDQETKIIAKESFFKNSLIDLSRTNQAKNEIEIKMMVAKSDDEADASREFQNIWPSISSVFNLLKIRKSSSAFNFRKIERLAHAASIDAVAMSDIAAAVANWAKQKAEIEEKMIHLKDPSEYKTVNFKVQLYS